MKASVIICTYNRAKLLRESILSILNQDFPSDEFEIIVVDNNSTDNTKDIVSELAASSPVKIEYVFEGQQGGSSYAHITGLTMLPNEHMI